MEYKKNLMRIKLINKMTIISSFLISVNIIKFVVVAFTRQHYYIVL